MNIDELYSAWSKLRDWYLGPTIRFRHADSAQFLELDNALANSLGPLTPSTVDAKQLHATSPLDASGGSVFLNLLGAAQGALIRAAASTQPLGGFRLRHFARTC